MLGIFKLKESYKTLKIALQEIINDLEQIKTVTIDGVTFKIEWTLGGDLKWLATIRGINLANSNQPCIWCTWIQKSFEVKENQIWSINERSVRKAKYNLNSRIKKKDGYKNDPLFQFVEFNMNVIDPLHLFLRITDKLFKNLLVFLEELDNNDSFDFEKRPHLKRLNSFLIDNLKITSPFYFSKNKIKFRNLNQNERLKFFKKNDNGLENLEIIFPEIKPLSEEDTNVQRRKMSQFIICFKLFYKLFMYCKNDFSEIDFDKERYDKYSKKWIDSYLEINEKKKITPYIHLFIHHIPEFVQKFKNLNLYSMQALEKLNSVTKTHFFFNTNKKTDTFVKQLLEKANRLEFINLNVSMKELFDKTNDQKNSTFDPESSSPAKKLKVS